MKPQGITIYGVDTGAGVFKAVYDKDTTVVVKVRRKGFLPFSSVEVETHLP